MKLAIVGGNSGVSKELCFYLRDQGADPQPIVRSRLAASFLNHHEFDCHIADVTAESEAQDVLDSADAVVIAAFARQYSRDFQPKQARRANEQLIRNSIKHSPPDATVIYLSSIAAFGPPAGFSRYDWYTQEKRNAESHLQTCADQFDCEAYALRLGPVIGKNQGRTEKIRNHITGDELHLHVAPDKESNLVHVATLSDAVQTCTEAADLNHDVYTLTNEPRWTWEDVFSYYAPEGSTLYFYEDASSEGSILNTMFGKLWNIAESHERSLRSLSIYLPDRINQRIFNTYADSLVRNDIETLRGSSDIRLSAFTQDSVPGPFLPNLTDTVDLLKDEEYSEIFNTKHRFGVNHRSRDGL